MNASITMWLLTAGFLFVAGLAVYIAARRWWDYLIMAVIAGLLIKPTAQNITGDISPWMPASLLDSPNGKDEFIWVSIVATLCLPVFIAAMIFWLIRTVFGRAGRNSVPSFPKGDPE